MNGYHLRIYCHGKNEQAARRNADEVVVDRQYARPPDRVTMTRYDSIGPGRQWIGCCVYNWD